MRTKLAISLGLACLSMGAVATATTPSGLEQHPAPPQNANTADEGSPSRREAEARDRDTSVTDLDEVTVRGRKREESLANVPSSISVIGGDEFERAGGRNLRDVELDIPNVNFSGQSNLVNNIVTIRGIGTDTRSIGLESGAAFYLDGVLLNRPGLFGLVTNDLASMEVFRGPQGTEFGRNALSGVFYSTTRKPGDIWEYEGMVGAGNYGFRETSQVLSGPLSDTVGMRAALQWKERGQGTVKNVLGEDPGKHNPMSGRVNLTFRPTDSTQVELIGSYAKDTISLATMEFFETPALANTTLARYSCSHPNRVDIDYGSFIYNAACLAVPGPRTTADPDPTNQEVSSRGVQINLNQSLGTHWAMRWINAYYDNTTHYQFSMANGADGSGGMIAAFDDDADQISSELQIISSVGSAGGRPWDVIGGLFFFRENQRSYRYLDLGMPSIPVADDDGYPTGDWLEVLEQNGNQRLNSYAAYLNGNYYVNDQWTLNLGLRTSREKRTARQVQNGSIQFYVGRFLDRTMTLNETVTTGTVSLQYAASDNVRMYGKWARGFKPGGVNLDTTSGSAGGIDLPSSFGPETTDLLELGLRASMPQLRASLHLTLFHQVYKNQQNTVLFPGNPQALALPGQLYGTTAPDGNVIANIGNGVSRGGELEFNWRATDALGFRLGYGYTDATYDKRQREVTQYDDSVNTVLNSYIARVAGGPLPYTREHTVSFSSYLTLPVKQAGFMDFHTRLGYQSPENGRTPGLKADRHFNVGANVAFRDQRGRYQVELYGDNLTDETYLVYVFGNSFSNFEVIGGVYNMPRTYGVRFRYFPRW